MPFQKRPWHSYHCHSTHTHRCTTGPRYGLSILPSTTLQVTGCETRDALPGYSSLLKYELLMDAEVRLRCKFCDIQLRTFIPWFCFSSLLLCWWGSPAALFKQQPLKLDIFQMCSIYRKARASLSESDMRVAQRSTYPESIDSGRLALVSQDYSCPHSPSFSTMQTYQQDMTTRSQGTYLRRHFWKNKDLRVS